MYGYWVLIKLNEVLFESVETSFFVWVPVKTSRKVLSSRNTLDWQVVIPLHTYFNLNMLPFLYIVSDLLINLDIHNYLCTTFDCDRPYNGYNVLPDPSHLDEYNWKFSLFVIIYTTILYYIHIYRYIPHICDHTYMVYIT